MKKILTSESVGLGHPDKTCDTIADSFLDAALSQDPNSQMAVECAIKNDKLFIYGEATTKAVIDYDEIAKKVLTDIGYTCPFTIVKEISIQSPDINRAVVKDEICANDQGMMFGYATNETEEYMPLSITVAHKLMIKYDAFRRINKDKFFADAKSQVSVEYGEDDMPEKIVTVVLSASHSDSLTLSKVKEVIIENVIKPVLQSYKKYAGLNLENVQFIVNPSSKFTIWGSFGDSGCVGRKIVCDTYGGVGRVGGGCFSSKNSSKVDRSAAYYARYVAKNLVANKLCDKCEIEVAYAIGLRAPISIYINTFDTEKVDLQTIYDIVSKNFDFSVSNIIKELDLNRPIYTKTASFGHFGREDFPWEKVITLIIWKKEASQLSRSLFYNKNPNN